MNRNTFGSLFKVTTFGESHGAALGVVIDGCPSGVSYDEKLLLSKLQRRKPGEKSYTSSRSEADLPELLSGIYEGKTLGTPIAFLVRNQDARPSDYEEIKTRPRPGHADDLWKAKFGCADHRGGGRASGRETVSRVIAGGLAEMFIVHELPLYHIQTSIAAVGGVAYGCPVEALSADLIARLEEARKLGESYGAEVSIRVSGMVRGLGQPVFSKLKADLASAVMSVGAVQAMEFGLGKKVAAMKGTELHRGALPEADRYGGIRGGISTGDDLLLGASFKPTASILDVAKAGRHDPCVAIRAAVVLESMVHLVIADHLLWRRLDQLTEHEDGSEG